MSEDAKDIPIYPGEQITRFYSGKIRIIQKEAGYRFSIDAALLANFTRTTPEQTILELGAGGGIVLILLSETGKSFKHATGLEIQKDLADRADRSVRLNGLARRIKIIHGDFREGHRLLQEEKFDIVISNPPYLKVDEGRLSPSLEKAVARHELKCTLDDVVRSAGTLIKERGRFLIIYPMARYDHLNQALKKFGFSPVRQRFIRASVTASPNLVLMEAATQAPPAGLEEEKILTLFDDEGHYTGEAADILFNTPADFSVAGRNGKKGDR
jgi:tRNA1(Val) A37 N6-methylase TrmN6